MPLSVFRSLIVLVITASVLSGCAIVESQAARREKQFEARFPPTGQLLNVDGVTVHADIRGSGPDLVLIHGASGNTRDFTFDLVGRLSDRYRVISFDRPGFGYTDTIGDKNVSPMAQADLLRRAAAQIGVTHPIVLGHSYGGAVAMAWALEDPNDTAAVVILSGATYPWPGKLGGLYPLFASPLGEAAAVPLVTAFAPESIIDRAINEVFEPQIPPLGYSDYIGAQLVARRKSFAANAEQLVALKSWLTMMAPHYSALTMPIELVHGGADMIVGVGYHSRRMLGDVESAHLTTLKGVGHMIHHAAPEEVVRAIDRAAERAGIDTTAR